jgi:hypothetical protein
MTGAVTTNGDVAEGVRALSVGGGGGDSGTTITASEGSTLTANVTVGGSGGDGGSAGSASATAADVATKGHSSPALSAVSVGGGGGSSHFAGAFSAGGEGALNTAIGGSGLGRRCGGCLGRFEWDGDYRGPQLRWARGAQRRRRRRGQWHDRHR